MTLGRLQWCHGSDTGDHACWNSSHAWTTPLLTCCEDGPVGLGWFGEALTLSLACPILRPAKFTYLLGRFLCFIFASNLFTARRPGLYASFDIRVFGLFCGFILPAYSAGFSISAGLFCRLILQVYCASLFCRPTLQVFGAVSPYSYSSTQFGGVPLFLMGD